jgi:hypothetical protein
VVSWENITIRGYQNKSAQWKMDQESKDYFILFRDTEVPELTDSDNEKRCTQEDLLLADRATYVWGHIGVLTGLCASFVQRHLDKPLEEEYKEKVEISNASAPCQFGYEIAVYHPFATILKKLSKISPNLAFLFNVPRLPLQRFWYFPESDDESWQIRQLLESQNKQDGRGIFWHLHRITIPKTHSHRSEARRTHSSETLQTRTFTQPHRSFAQVLSLDTIVDGLKRVDYSTKMDVTRRAAAVWVIETSLTYEKLTRPGFTRKIPSFMATPQIFLDNPRDVRAAFESAIADEKYLPTLSDRQLAILERGITLANNFMTSFRPAHRKIANKYEAMRLNNKAKRISDDEKRIEEEKKRINDEEKKNVEEKKRINEEAKRVSDKIYSPFPHLMEAANNQGIDTSESSDSPLLELIKEQNEILKERLPLPTTETELANTRTVEYSEKALEQRADEIKPIMNVLERIAENTDPDKLIKGFGREMQDVQGMYHDQLNENEFEFAQRLKRTYPKKTYDEIAAMVGERFPDGKYQAGDGEKLRKALNPPKKKE